MLECSAVGILKFLMLFEQRALPCRFSLDIADYAVGSEYTTVLFPLTPEKHILIPASEIFIQPSHPQTEQDE